MTTNITFARRPIACAILACSLFTIPISSQAARFQLGDLHGSFDSTISIGASWRATGIDKELVAPGNFPGGEAQSSTNDDGNLNFKRGKTYSKIIKGVHDLSLNYENVGAFTRFKYWYDKELADEARPHGHGPNQYQPGAKLNDDNFSDNAKFSGFEFLDAFVYGNFYLGNVPTNLRLGKQVISWGESTFISNSINAVNPFDVAAFRRPGAEIKEGLLPVNMVYLNAGLTEDLSLEAFYQLEWKKTEIDACGTYFSTTDVVADGCNFLTLSPDFPDQVLVAAPGGALTRSGDVEPKDDGQFGLALRYYAQALNDTEFGLYYMNLHSRLPFVGVSTEGGIPTYYVECPEDIQLIGLSFNTNVGAFAWSGEISHRKDSPVQINGSEVIGGLFGALGLAPANTYSPEVRLGERTPGYDLFDITQMQSTLLRIYNQVLGASRLVVIGEAGFTHIHGSLNDHPYGRSTNYGSGSPGDDGFVTNNSAGYRLRGALEYSNVFANVNLSPNLSWSHDVYGFSPSGGAFNEGDKAISIGVDAEYNNTFKASLSYTNFFGGDFNTINDRDFIAASASVTF
ncbi:MULTISPECIES: DUF1302 domain-containing protein [Marinobacter]|uniref:DUF1302 domain-containing protein n=1 Tax=Marinobacter TaxID=2742 RepID=UPI003B43CE7B|nr:DUF1302 domain-containing protein [Marinobacter alkaliphilus]